MEKRDLLICTENVFHQHRAEIADISRNDDCDISTAARKWATENGVHYGDELKEFETFISFLQSEAVKGKNLVKEYFDGLDGK